MLAACAHPVAAWRHGTIAVRLHVVVGYVVSSYVLVLLGLLLAAPSGS